MKHISLKVLAVLLFGMTIMQSCSKEEASPQEGAKNNLVRTWRVNPASITINGTPVNVLLTAAGVPEALRPNYSLLRLTFNADNSYRVEGVDLAGIPPTGTWAFDGSSVNRVVINPGAIGVSINDLTASSFKISYSFPTAGTTFAALGASARVDADMVSP